MYKITMTLKNHSDNDRISRAMDCMLSKFDSNTTYVLAVVYNVV